MATGGNVDENGMPDKMDGNDQMTWVRVKNHKNPNGKIVTNDEYENILKERYQKRIETIENNKN